MLSVMKVSNVKQASAYYNSPDQYYFKGEGDKGSRWGGKGAEELGLAGKVEGEDFVRLLEGRINNETHLGRISKDGEIDHVPGWDFTFSAPKSISILALVGGDERLVKAHLDATEKAMEYIEKNYALTRITEGGETRYQKVDNLVFAGFTHTESRKNDPQLHTHNVVMNAVQDSDGQWRSLETLRMFEGKLMSGLIYRYELANQVKKLGYNLEVTDREKGFFDIRGIPETLMANFSKRRQQVMEAAQQRGLFDQVSLAKATIFSRDAKNTPDREALHESWAETVKESGVDLQSIIEQSIENESHDHQKPAGLGERTDEDIIKEEQVSGVEPQAIIDVPGADSRDHQKDAQDSAAEHLAIIDESGTDISGYLLTAKAEEITPDVRLAYKVLAESEAVFNAEDLVKEVMRLTLTSGISTEDINHVLDAMIAEGELLTRNSRTKPGELAFTTPRAFDMERQMISTMLNGKDSRSAIGVEHGINEFINLFEKQKSTEFGTNFRFSDDQRTALVEAATNKDLVSGIQGFAGTGKTTLLECFIRYAEQQGYEVKGFAPTGSAKDTMANETGIKTQTVDSFLFQRKKGEVSSGEVWLVDEASLVNLINTYKMVNEADKSNAKLILLGDKQQHESVEWGKAFHVLQGFKMATSHVTSIIRQKNESLLDAVYHSIDRQWGAAFEKIKDTTYTLKERSLVNDYLSFSSDERSKTLVIIPDNKGRSDFNKTIHKERVSNGELSADEFEIKVLINANLNSAQRRDSRYYKPGLTVEFQRDHELFIAGEFWDVVKVTPSMLTLKNIKGEVRDLDPKTLPEDSKFSLDVFEREKILVSKGEVLRVNKSRKELAIRNGDELTVKNGNAADKTITITDANGRDITISTEQLHNLDYNYALTSFGAQGKTVDRVMAVVESWRKNLVNFRSVYVTLSRARNEAHLYVDNKKQVIDSLYKHHADKSTSLSGMSQGDMRRYATWKNEDKSNTDYRSLFADLNFVTEKLALRQGVFSHTDLLKETLKHSIGTYDVHDVEKGISLLRTRGELGLSRISGEGRKTEVFYSLPTNIKTEAQIVRHMLQGRGKLPAIAGKSVVESYVKARNERAAAGECEPVSAAAGAALENILSSRDETILVLGTDHSGHKELMRSAGRLIAENNGYKVRSFSTNAEGVNQLRETVKNAQNVYAHISHIEERIAANDRVRTKKEIWVVENASQLGADDVLRLQHTARYAGARIMLVADRQESALSWGNIPTLLLQNGVKSVNLEHSFRSRNKEINLASDAIVQGRIEKALAHVGPMIESVNAGDNHAEGREARINTLASTYLNLDKSGRGRTAVVIPDYFNRNKVDLRIRDGLRLEGSLMDHELITTLYRNANLDPMEKRRAQYYKVGQVVEFENDRQGAKKGEYFTILSVNPQTNKMTLTSNMSGQSLTINADDIAGSRGNSVRVYHVEEKAIAIGEEVRFNRSASKERLIDTDKSVPTKLSGVVKNIEGDIIHLTMQNGREVKLDTKTFKHLEYSYTQNLYDIKDKRFENVVALMESGKKHFATQSALHNVITKSTLNLRIVTDDKDKLIDSLRNQEGFQQTALNSRKVSISKSELQQFDKTFGLGLSPVNRGLTRLENAFSHAVSMAREKVAEKVTEVRKEVYQPQKQRSL